MEKRIEEQINATKRFINSAEMLIEEIESEITRLQSMKNRSPQHEAQLRLLYHLSNFYDDTL